MSTIKKFPALKVRDMPGFKYSESRDYPAREFVHRFVTTTNGVVRTGVSLAYEVCDIEGNPFWFTEEPCASWHRPLNDFWNYWTRPNRDRNRNSCDVSASLDQFEAAGKFKFFPAQRRAIQAAYDRKNVLLIGDVGTGKTLMALALIMLHHQLARVNGVEKPRSFLVVPHGVLGQWWAEATKFFPGISIATAEEALATPSAQYELVIDWPQHLFHTNHSRILDPLMANAWTTTTVDESHMYAVGSSQMTNGLHKLKGGHRIALSATPLPNKTVDLFPVLGWLSSPGWFGGTTAPEFPYRSGEAARFAAENSDSEGMPNNQMAVTLAPLITTLEKQECVVDLPVMHVHEIILPLTDEQRKRLKRMSPERQRQALYCGGFSRPRLASFAMFVERCLRDRTQGLAVAARTEQLDGLAELLTELGISYLRIDGRSSASSHAATAARFKEGAAPILLMGAKCAQSYSFQQCPALWLGSVGYSYAEFWQVIGRIWRVNSIREVHVFVPRTEGTIETTLWKYVEDKEACARETLFKGSNLKDYIKKHTKSIAPCGSVITEGYLLTSAKNLLKWSLDRAEDVSMVWRYGINRQDRS